MKRKVHSRLRDTAEWGQVLAFLLAWWVAAGAKSCWFCREINDIWEEYERGSTVAVLDEPKSVSFIALVNLQHPMLHCAGYSVRPLDSRYGPF